jgi:hypothetical protein
MLKGTEFNQKEKNKSAQPRNLCLLLTSEILWLDRRGKGLNDKRTNIQHIEEA